MRWMGGRGLAEAAAGGRRGARIELHHADQAGQPDPHTREGVPHRFVNARVPISQTGSIAFADPPALNCANVFVERMHKIVGYTPRGKPRSPTCWRGAI